jgi:hypothetical protein
MIKMKRTTSAIKSKNSIAVYSYCKTRYNAIQYQYGIIC